MRDEQDRRRRRRDSEDGRHNDDPKRTQYDRRHDHDRGTDRTYDRNSEGHRYLRKKELEIRPEGRSSRSDTRWSDGRQPGGDAHSFEDTRIRSGDRDGGVYGPADTGRPSGGGNRGWGGSGGGGRGHGNGTQRDESWVEHRLKLRSEAKQPRGVWNRSPSPPKKKETKRTVLSAHTRKPEGNRNGKETGSKEAHHLSTSKRTRKKNVRRKRRARSPSSTSSDSDSRKSNGGSESSGSSSSSSSSSSSGSGSSSDNSVSDSGSSSGDSDSGRNGEGEGKRKRDAGKGQKRPPSAVKKDQGKLELTKTAVVAPSILPPAEVDPKAHDSNHHNISPEDLDEMDAAEAAQFKADVQGHRHQENAKNSDDDEGPMPVPQLDELQGDGERGVNYGGALLPGEGAAIAQFVQKGLRIPRRGEVGWAGQEIEKLEDSGYVMSGSRHARMNAVRLRKENQVFNAEERRALALIMFEEKQQKENEILGNFRQMLTESTREGEKAGGESEPTA